MLDARERAILDYQSAINSARREGKLQGMYEAAVERGKSMGMIETYQEFLGVTVTDKAALCGMSTEELQALASELQQTFRARLSS
jgi:hypothetical protein